MHHRCPPYDELEMPSLFLTPVTILLPVRNGAPWLHASLDSLLIQDHSNIEILLVDDGSTDDSASIAKDVAGALIRVIQGNRKGLANALALGVESSDSEFIARMDQDDVAHSSRISGQVRFLSENSDHVMVGSNVRLMNSVGCAVGYSHFPETDAGIRMRMTIGNPFAHSSVMFRKSAVLSAGNYWSPSSDPFPEDYHLWTRLAEIGFLANLRDVLLDYRVHELGVSKTHASALQRSRGLLAWQWFCNVQPQHAKDRELERAWVSCFGGTSRITFRQAASIVSNLIRLRTRGQQVLAGGGFRLRHYLYPLTRVLAS